MEDKKFGDSGNNIVIEGVFIGPEVSVLAFTDGKCVEPMVSSKDHKRAFDNDEGPKYCAAAQSARTCIRQTRLLANLMRIQSLSLQLRR